MTALRRTKKADTARPVNAATVPIEHDRRPEMAEPELTGCARCGVACGQDSKRMKDGKWRVCAKHPRGLEWSSLVEELCGTVIDDYRARLLCQRGQAPPLFSEVRSWTSPPSEEAWAHVSPTARATLASDAERIKREAIPGEGPRPCASGRCSWCGIREAVQWWEAPGGVLCDACDKHYSRLDGELPLTAERTLREVAMAATGVRSVGVRLPPVKPWKLVGGGEGRERWDFIAEPMRSRVRRWRSVLVEAEANRRAGRAAEISDDDAVMAQLLGGSL